MSDSEEQDPIAQSSTDIESSPTDVWDALCHDTEVWLGPGSSIQPVESGAVDANDIVTGTRRAGTVTAAQPGERLVFDWWPVDDPAESTTVSVTLLPIGPQTRVVITETLPSRLTSPKLSATPTAGVSSSGALALTGLATATPVWRGAMLSFACSLKVKVGV